MLTLFRRHTKSCPHRSRRYRRCSCPIHVEGTLGDEQIRRALDLTSWAAAEDRIREWTFAGQIGGRTFQAVLIAKAVDSYLADARSRHLAAATVRKLTTIFEKQFVAWANSRGYRYLKELTPERLSDWRSTWRDGSLAASKKYQRAAGFFHFCIRMRWITENPMKALTAPKVRHVPTLPFTADEMASILSACDQFPIKTIYGKATRARVRAMVLLLRYSGLRIRDAATLQRDRISNGKLLLYTQKTGVPVYIPLPEFVLHALDEVPVTSPLYFFWTGTGPSESTVGHWEYTFRRLFELASIEKGHAHRFRDTFAIELLLAGVHLDQVSILLGHSSVKITEKSYAPWVKARQEQLEVAVMKTWPSAN